MQVNTELPDLSDDLEYLSIYVVVRKGEVIDEDEATKVAVEAARRAIRERNGSVAA